MSRIISPASKDVSGPPLRGLKRPSEPPCPPFGSSTAHRTPLACPPLETDKICYEQGQSPNSKAPGFLGRGLWQAQDLARPERTERNQQRQLTSDDPQTCRRWPHHPQARYHALPLSCPSPDGSEADRQTQRIRQEEGYQGCSYAKVR